MIRIVFIGPGFPGAYFFKKSQIYQKKLKEKSLLILSFV